MALLQFLMGNFETDKDRIFSGCLGASKNKNQANAAAVDIVNRTLNGRVDSFS